MARTLLPRESSWERRHRAWLVWLLMLLGASASSGSGRAQAADRYRVVVLRPAVSDEVTSDALARVQGELTAAGFDVRLLPRDPTVPVRTALETSGRELDPIATFAIIRGDAGDTAEIWVCDRVAGKSVIQNVRLETQGLEVDRKRGATVLAVQAVELLKASLAHYWIEPGQQRVTPPPTNVEPPPPPMEPPQGLASSPVALQAAVGWLYNAGAVPSVWQPLVRASYGNGRWAGRLTATGFGSEAVLQSGARSARIRQELAVLELARLFPIGSRAQILGSVGFGGYHIGVDGSGTSPSIVGRQSEGWSVAAMAGAGVALKLVPHVALAVEAHGFVTLPRTTVRFSETEEAGRTGWPALLLSAGLMGTF
jgi:hypothetical protein